MTAETRPVYIVEVPTDEPRDRLDTADIEVIRRALDIYYGELIDNAAPIHDFGHVARLSRRLADVSLVWIAEEVTE